MAAAGATQSSSPRLPSPPPFTEVQIGPKSPSVGESFGKDAEQILGTSPSADDASTRRIRPGTKAVDMAAGPPLIPLAQLDSPFQLQEHLKALYHHFTRPEGSDTVVPITRDIAVDLAQPPDGVDRSLWLYELCRFLTMKVNNLIVAFFSEEPPCSSQTCPEMRASEWQYLCAVHDPPKSCCAIDYCCHTLDWATNILTSPKHFPSRLTLGSEAAGGPQASMRHLTNIFRRLYRIFAHAWFQHREVFWEVEGHDGLYVFFKTVCDMYHLIPEDNYTVPPEAEGIDAQSASPEEQPADMRRMTILRKDDEASLTAPSLDNIEPSSITGATTRRHKNSPSISSREVTTINESAEDEESAPKTQPAPAVDETQPRETESQTSIPGTSEEQTPDSTIDSTGSQITVAEVSEEEEAPKPAEELPKATESDEPPVAADEDKLSTVEKETAPAEAPEGEPQSETKETTSEEHTQTEAAAPEP
ncbi:Mob1 family protein [Aspergillus ambiguus]|uniref:Mob1 family protein n=1 Tax=Aspergillus ambiguus TaxID=176160 RepID=UPI003CCD06F1